MHADATIEPRLIEQPKLSRVAVPLALLAGFVARAVLANGRFLNPDEALHYLISAEPSASAVYKASLTTVHPPLFFLLLHFWMRLGHSELMLRLPSIFAGVGFSWFMYRWLLRVQGRAVALTALFLFLFLPSFVDLSAEIRQYSLLLFFASASLYFFDLAIERDSWRDSWRWMVLSALALWLAILTHYSALIFALSMGIYAFLRLAPSRRQRSIGMAWAAGQCVAISLCWFLYVTHISGLRSSGTSQMIADTWLRMSVFHPGQDHIWNFAFTRTVRLFRFLFTQGTVGVLGLLLFLLGLISLRTDGPATQRRPKSLQLILLLLLPFAITLALSMAGKYPYGGTRHDALLGMFAIPAVSIGLVGRYGSRPTIVAS